MQNFNRNRVFFSARPGQLDYLIIRLLDYLKSSYKKEEHTRAHVPLFYMKILLLDVVVGLVGPLVNNLSQTVSLGADDCHTVHLDRVKLEDTTEGALLQLVGVHATLLDKVFVGDA